MHVARINHVTDTNPNAPHEQVSGILPGSNCVPSSALLTDMYELTMLQAALMDGTAHRQCAFEVFTRRLPNERRYGVLAGTARVLEAVNNFRFTDDQVDRMDFLNKETKDFCGITVFPGGSMVTAKVNYISRNHR